MSDIGNRLKRLREDRGYADATAAANAMGIPVSTYTQNENGTRDPGKVRVRKYAEFFHTTPEFLLYGRERPVEQIASAVGYARGRRGARTIPVFSWVAAGRMHEPEAQLEPSETIEISGLPAGDYFGTRVQGDSMDRLSPSGSLIIVNRAETELIRGRRYIFNYRGETTYKRWEPDPDRLMPESTNPANESIFPRNHSDWSVIGRVRLTLLDDI